MRRVTGSDDHGHRDWPQRRHTAQDGRCLVFATFPQQLLLRFCHQGIQALELTVEIAGALPHSSFRQLRQPLLPFRNVVNSISFTADPPAAIDRFQSILYSGAVPHHTFVTVGRLLQRPRPVIAVVYRPQHPGLQ